MIRWAAFTLLLVAFAGCPPATDLGKECTLVRRNPNDGGPPSIPITEAEIKGGRDFISFGSTACEDSVCVRDSSYVRPANIKDTDPALGYCSTSCTAQGSVTGCTPAVETDRLSCRALILDEETLAAICQADPTICKRYFGDTTSPLFCARGGSADGGTQ
jgi:hypothetical protein